MNKLKFLVIHCAATPEGRPVSAEDVRRWHIEGRGWSRVGYADFVHLDGRVQNMTPYDGDDWVQNEEMTWGVRGINRVSRHVVYAGGLDAETWVPKDTRTERQKLALANYVRMSITIWPDLLIAGHNQFSAKACPCFSVPAWLREIGIPEKNIYEKA